jgi:uncharacterized repeat protein (TIGR03806 family)
MKTNMHASAAKFSYIVLASMLWLSATVHATDPPIQNQAKRLPWKTSKVVGSPDPIPPYLAKRAFPKLHFKNPTVLTSAPGTNRLFVAEQHGKIYSIADDEQIAQAELLLDINDCVQGLNEGGAEVVLGSVYGLTFHPNFAKNGKFFVCYTVRHKDGSKGAHPHGTRVSQFQRKNKAKPADPTTEKCLISWLQGGHNGGCIKFGHDGYLYISAGDGGFAFPPDGLNSGQDVSNLRSSVFRIDVDQTQGELPYAIPADNPFVKTSGARPEIWAYGMRNPWKMSFDRKTGALWVGDVGWELWELIYRVKPGDNFGWSLMEGRQPVNTTRKRGPTAITPPTIEIPHSDGASITGGFVYRGKKFPELVGSYIFGDWETRRIWAAKLEDDSVKPYVDILDPTVRIICFAEDNLGELLLLDYSAGTIHRMEKNRQVQQRAPFPTKLSQTGLFASVEQLELADGVVPFEINSPVWSDGASAQRFIGLPGSDGVKLHFNKARVAGSMFRRQMDFTKGTVLGKTIFAPSKTSNQQRIETQILHFDGLIWRGYSYKWNAQQTDATLVESAGERFELELSSGTDKPASSRFPWTIPSRQQCVRCHNPWAEHALAFNVAQLNRNVHAQVDHDGVNQIEEFRRLGIIENVTLLPDPKKRFGKARVPKEASKLPRLSRPFGDDALPLRARAYLHANCAHCHREGGGGSAQLHLPADLPLLKMKAFNLRPTQGTFGIANAKILAPGDPYRSTLYFRMAKLGPGRMPHVGSELVDHEGVKLIHDWIRQLPPRLDELELLQQLIANDERPALAKERRLLPETLWKLARQAAAEHDRSKPDKADQAQAEKLAAEQAAQGAVQRMEARTLVIEQLLESVNSSLVLLKSINDNQLSADIVEQVVKLSQASTNASIVDTFEQLVPLQQRTKRLGEKVVAGEILQLTGNPRQGQHLFMESSTLTCKSCHRIGKTGGQVGPDLSQIAKRLKRSQLLESILEPSRQIDPKYATWIVETVDGKVHTGVLKEKTTDHVILLTAKNEPIKIPRGEIEILESQRTSMMPQSLVKALTVQQLADLLSYLETLK